AGIGVDDGINPAGQDIDRMRGDGARRHVERVEGDALNVAVQPVDGRKIEMIRIMREIGNGIEIAGARMRIAGGYENERVAAAAAGDRVTVLPANERVGARAAYDDEGVGRGKVGIDGQIGSVQ